MKVRIFLPGDSLLEPFAFGEFSFDAMPSVGEFLQFADLDGADYPIERTGYIQDGECFVGAVWLGPPIERESLVAIEVASEEVERTVD